MARKKAEASWHPQKRRFVRREKERPLSLRRRPPGLNPTPLIAKASPLPCPAPIQRVRTSRRILDAQDILAPVRLRPVAVAVIAPRLPGPVRDQEMPHLSALRPVIRGPPPRTEIRRKHAEDALRPRARLPNRILRPALAMLRPVEAPDIPPPDGHLAMPPRHGPVDTLHLFGPADTLLLREPPPIPDNHRLPEKRTRNRATKRTSIATIARRKKTMGAPLLPIALNRLAPRMVKLPLPSRKLISRSPHLMEANRLRAS